MATMHLLITGKVQGVFYRATAKQVAFRLGLTGWIKNIPSGDVEAVITGNEDQLKQFVDWARLGPDNAAVENVLAQYLDEQQFETFKVERHAK